MTRPLGSIRMHGRRSTRLASSTLVLLVLFAALLAAREGLAQGQSLLAKAQAEGSVRVIVELQAAFDPVGGLPQAVASSQQQGIAVAQDRLLARLAGYGVAKPKRFRSIPFLALEVDVDALTALASDPGVAAIQEDVPFPALELADGDLASPESLSNSTAVLGAPGAWAAGYTGSGQVVAVLDTGVQKTHPFLQGKVVSEACYSSNDASYGSSSVCPGGVEASTAAGSALNCDLSVSGCDHGTHVAGIAAGTNPSFSGVAKDGDLIAVQIFSRFDNPTYCGSRPCVLSWTSDQIQGLERVLALSSSFGIASVNMSLGGGRYYTTASCDASNAAVKAAIDNLRSVGIATVIASGNNGYEDSMGAPGCISSAVSVGSTNMDEGISFFSNEAPFLSLYAPGFGINSSVPVDLYRLKSGTSMATPHIAGAWAVVKQRAVNADVDHVLAVLSSTGVPITSSTGAWTTPRPRLDIAVAEVSRLRSALDLPTENEIVSLPLDVMGWAFDQAVLSGVGVDEVRIRITPSAGGSPVVDQAAGLGVTRTDVGAVYGSQFTPSGYALSVSTPLSPGPYVVDVTARSSITGVFEPVSDRQILVPGPIIAVDSPVAGVTSGWPIVISGWAVHSAASTGTGVDSVQVWAVPTGGGAGIFLGDAALGNSRPDVAAYLGHSRFEPSGFYLESTELLAPGDYAIRVSARSTTSGTFFDAPDIPVAIVARNVAQLDVPGEGASLSSPFDLAGWAFNTGVPGSTGVSDVHAWAFPLDGGAPIFLGVANLGLIRPDVSAYFGQPDVSSSGYELHVTAPLADGDYTMRIYVRDVVSATFSLEIERLVTVGSDPRMNIDVPAASASVSVPFVVSGWAVDLAASSGTGVDEVHLWAFPNAGGAPTFLGIATLGGSRPDVGGYFANPQFDPAGFSLDVATPLGAGAYQIAAYARSTVTGTFNNSVKVAVAVTVP